MTIQAFHQLCDYGSSCALCAKATAQSKGSLCLGLANRGIQALASGGLECALVFDFPSVSHTNTVSEESCKAPPFCGALMLLDRSWKMSPHFESRSIPIYGSLCLGGASSWKSSPTYYLLSSPPSGDWMQEAKRLVTHS